MKIKENDIFHSNIGITCFYQVVKVYNSGRVRIREIEKVEKPTDCGHEFLATPLKNKFRPQKESNDKGAVKIIKYFDDGRPYIDLKGNNWATLYEGKPVISDYWYVWVR